MLNTKLREDVKRVSKEMQRFKSGILNDEEWRRFRLQNGIYGVRFQKNIQMIRVKIPYGELTSNQLQMLGEIAELFSSGIGHVTTRQDIQMYWISLNAVPEVLRRLSEVGLTTRESSGHTVRNVTACPLAGVCTKEEFDITPYAKYIAYYFMRNPLAQNLPRKFKIAFSSCSEDCALGSINDLGVIAISKNHNGEQIKGFRIYVGGGLGSPPRAAHLLEDFTLADDLGVTCETVLRVFDRLGNRDNLQRARMKFLIEKIGINQFREMIFKERQVLRVTISGDPNTNVEDTIIDKKLLGITNNKIDDENFNKWLNTNVVDQKQKGFKSVFINLIGGDITSTQFKTLANIANKYADGYLRTTIRQDIVLRWVDQTKIYDMYLDLKKNNLITSGANTICDIVGCQGTDTCNLGVTRSHRLAMKLSEHLLNTEKNMFSKEFEGADIKVSGCPNSCGQNHISTIGLFGSAQRVNGRMVPFYQLQLGGSVSEGKVKFGEPIMRIPAKRVPQAVSEIIKLYRLEKKGDETFVSWINRLQLDEEND